MIPLQRSLAIPSWHLLLNNRSLSRRMLPDNRCLSSGRTTNNDSRSHILPRSIRLFSVLCILPNNRSPSSGKGQANKLTDRSCLVQADQPIADQSVHLSPHRLIIIFSVLSDGVVRCLHPVVCRKFGITNVKRWGFIQCRRLW